MRMGRWLLFCFVMLLVPAVVIGQISLGATQEVQWPKIVPGVAIGPVRLGMAASEGVRAVAAFNAATGGCTIDVLFAESRVIAAGTRFGGCLDLALPPGANPIGVAIAETRFPAWPAIGSAPRPFLVVFGRPAVIHLNNDAVALIWPTGLVARVDGIREGDGVVTYLAVSMPERTTVPPVGLLKTPEDRGSHTTPQHQRSFRSRNTNVYFCSTAMDRVAAGPQFPPPPNL